MRADRLLALLLHLQARGRLTARELARQLEVSERTIYRDVEALSAAGVPVVAERGTGGGLSLLGDYRTELTGLNAAEVQALFLTKPAHLLADLGLGQAAEGALAKLMAALPASGRRNAEYMRQRIHVDMAGWRRTDEAAPYLPTVQEALWQECKLRMTYRRTDGSCAERVVDPLGLIAKGSVWYLVAAVDGEQRTYRIARIQAATVTGLPAVRPEGFDLAAYWAQSAADFVANLPSYLATVRVQAAYLPHIRGHWRYARIEHEDPPDEAGWARVVLRFETEDNASEYVLGLGPFVEALEPAELRARIRRQAAETVSLYGRTEGDEKERG